GKYPPEGRIGDRRRADIIRDRSGMRQKGEGGSGHGRLYLVAGLLVRIDRARLLPKPGARRNGSACKTKIFFRKFQPPLPFSCAKKKYAGASSICSLPTARFGEQSTRGLPKWNSVGRITAPSISSRVNPALPFQIC